MRQIQIYILSVIILATFFCVSCEKDDKNGELDGNWQLTEWKDTQGIIKADKSSSIFYTVKLD
ncbi:MAG: lipocalin-like domain-containing protein, partial [Prevotellaceae bacterium]|nr:lipocalin-like domain-containing protein [Candidatus Colivivens equi]